MVLLALTEEEAEYLDDILGLWNGDMELATNEVIRDRTLDSPEDLLEAVQGMHEIHDLGAAIAFKLQEARREHDASTS